MNFFQRMVYIVQQYGMSLLEGAGTTMAIAIICTLLGCVIGFAVGLVQTIEPHKNSNIVKRAILKVVKFILTAYVEVFRGTPMMLQAAFIYYGTAQVFGINLGMWSAAIIIVSVNTGAYMAETVRGGILSIDPGQREGARAIGMSQFQTMLLVILPQSLRNFTFRSISGALYTYFEAATVTMIIYFILTFACSRLLRWIENRMDGPANFDLATGDTLAFTSGLVRYDEKRGGTH